MKYHTLRENFFRITLTACIAVAVVAGCALADGPADCINIPTDKGKVTGVLNKKDGLCIYRGIPYAAPPVGALRFTNPKEPAQWGETLLANRFGDECIQFPFSLFPAGNPTGSEDCLYLNIWQPVTAADAPMPVMIFIHGGGFVLGSGSQSWYEGTHLASIGKVILVTFNYRLGPFGFLVHPALRDEKGLAGNYGMYDQLAALQWVKRNIANFGGDADNVTIFGESAGGVSVGLLMLSPKAKGLFQKAIVQSGPAIMIGNTMEDEMKNGIAAAEKLGCTDAAKAADCLRSLDAKTIMYTVKPVIGLMSDSEMKSGFPYHPVVDGDFVPASPTSLYQKGEYDRDIKVMIGTNKDEATLFISQRKIDTPEDFNTMFTKDMEMIKKNFGFNADFEELLSLYPLASYPTPRAAYTDLITDIAFTCPTRILANEMSEFQSEVYLYHFCKAPTNKGMLKDWGAFHGAELPFLFGNFNLMGINLGSPENSEVSKKMIALWSSFARTGVPTMEGAPKWLRFNTQAAPYMRLDTQLSLGENLKGNECAYMEKVILEKFGK